MLPPIPEKLLKIDEVTAAEHFPLDEADACFYIWEYAVRQGYTGGPTNQLIKNLKIKPSEIAKSPARTYYKQKAIDHAAKALRDLPGRETAEGSYTFVPIPPSKTRGDSVYDDRTMLVLENAFNGWSSDLQPILAVKESMQADHESVDRMTFDDLLALTEVLPSTTPVHKTIVILDDVLNSGKHFKVAKLLLSMAHPTATILGIFLARCIRKI